MKRLCIVLCLLTLGAGVVSAQQNDPCMQKGGTMTNGQCVLTLDAKVSVDYPLDLATQHDLIAKTIDPFIQSVKNDFVDSLKGGFYPVPAPYELDIKYDTVNHSAGVVSLVFTVYEYTGGAHGITTITTYTFDTANNRLITLDDLFTNTIDALKIVAPIAQAAIAKNLGDMNQSDMLQQGTAIDPKNYDAFALNADSITFYFQQYQVGPGAAGIQQISIPLAQLSSVLQPDFAPST